jgi:hypothetical protein
VSNLLARDHQVVAFIASTGGFETENQQYLFEFRSTGRTEREVRLPRERRLTGRTLVVLLGIAVAVIRILVVSFGIDRAVDSTEPPTVQDGYEAICPYVKAFPTADAYREWSKTVDAPTVAIPLAGATELAVELAR